MFEAYSVAIRLRLLDSVTTGLIGLAGQFQALNRHVGTTRSTLSEVEKQLGRIKLLGVMGGAAAGAGFFGLSLFKAPLEEAKQFQTEAARFASLGFGDKVNTDAVKFATGMKTYGTSARENLTLLSDAMAVFKDLGHAEMAAPIMAKMRFANQAVFGAGGSANEAKFMDMLKVIEFRRGLSSPAEFESQANFVQKVISGSRNRVDATALLQALKTGGVALSLRSNEAFYLGSEPLIQEFGGSRYGTGAMSIYQNLVQSRGTITAQQELYRLGLLDPSRVQFNQLGQLKKALPGAFKGSGILEGEGELALLEKVLLPAFAAKGITSEEGVIRELGMLLGNRSGSGLMARIYQQRATLHMQSEANRSAQDINGLAATGSGILAGKELELHAKWRDVLKELGTSVLPLAIKAVEGLTTVVKGVVAFAREFPTLTTWLTVGFGVLAGVVAVGGTLMLATAGFKALGLALVVGRAAGIGGMLLQVAGGLGGLGLALGRLGLLGFLGYGTYSIATALGADKVGSWLADQLLKVTHPLDGSSERGGAKGSWGDTVAPRKGAGAAAPVVLNMDGRKVGEIVTGHQTRAMNGPQTGPNSFDGRMALTPGGATGTW